LPSGVSKHKPQTGQHNWGVFLVFPQSPREILEWNFKLGHDRFPPQPFKFNIDWSLHHETVSVEVDASLKKPYNTSETVLTNKMTMLKKYRILSNQSAVQSSDSSVSSVHQINAN
jgi:hypothetical protein